MEATETIEEPPVAATPMEETPESVVDSSVVENREIVSPDEDIDGVDMDDIDGVPMDSFEGENVSRDANMEEEADSNRTSPFYAEEVLPEGEMSIPDGSEMSIQSGEEQLVTSEEGTSNMETSMPQEAEPDTETTVASEISENGVGEGPSSTGEQRSANEIEILPNGLPLFTHCFACGHPESPPLVKFQKVFKKGLYKNKQLFKHKCAKCTMFFGGSYLLDVKTNLYVQYLADAKLYDRPFANGLILRQRAIVSYSAQEASERKALEKAKLLPVEKVEKPVEKKVYTKKDKVVVGVPTKKLPKGYQYEPILPTAAPPPVEVTPQVKEIVVYRDRPKPKMRTTAQQTGDDEHMAIIVIEEMKSKSMFEGLRPDDSIPLSSSISRRLLLTKKTLVSQGEEIRHLREEKADLVATFQSMYTAMKGCHRGLLEDLRRLRDDVDCAKNELKVLTDEMRTEAKKDIEVVRTAKETVASRISDLDKYRQALNKKVMFFENAAAQSDETMSKYHRLSQELERQLNAAMRDKEDAEQKLNDKIYIANNARCAHCTVSEKLKTMLKDQVAEKTLSCDALAKERDELARRLENAERVNQIITRDNKKIKFEMQAWEANYYKLSAESKRDALPLTCDTPSSSNHSSGDRVDLSSPDHSPPLSTSVPPARPPSGPPEEGEIVDDEKKPSPSLILPPPPAPPRTISPPVAGAFANWVPREKKNQPVPPEFVEAMKKVEEKILEKKRAPAVPTRVAHSARPSPKNASPHPHSASPRPSQNGPPRKRDHEKEHTVKKAKHDNEAPPRSVKQEPILKRVKEEPIERIEEHRNNNKKATRPYNGPESAVPKKVNKKSPTPDPTKINPPKPVPNKRIWNGPSEPEMIPSLVTNRRPQMMEPTRLSEFDSDVPWHSVPHRVNPPQPTSWNGRPPTPTQTWDPVYDRGDGYNDWNQQRILPPAQAPPHQQWTSDWTEPDWSDDWQRNDRRTAYWDP